MNTSRAHCPRAIQVLAELENIIAGARAAHHHLQAKGCRATVD